MNEKQDLVIFDSTQREGIQRRGTGGTEDIRALVSTLTAQFLKKGVIELGMPANPVDKSLMGRMINEFKNNDSINENDIGIAFLCRCTDFDIDEGANFFKPYPNNIMHLFIGTSKEHRSTRFHGEKGLKDYCDLIREKIQYAATKESVTQIMFSPEDTTRTYREGKDVLFQLLDSVLEGYQKGNTQIKRNKKVIFNIADTLGISNVTEINKIISTIKGQYKDEVDISVHLHNDMDMSTANTYEAYLTGAKYLQASWNGSGERNGIARMEPLLAKLVIDGHITNKDFLNPNNLKKMTALSKTIAHLYGWQYDENLAITGQNANLSTAGIHTNLTSKNTKTYHITGEQFGNPVGMSFCSTSGSSHLKVILENSGFKFNVTRDNITECTNLLKDLANQRQSNISDLECVYYAERIINEKKETNNLTIDNFELKTVFNKNQTHITVYGKYKSKEFTITAQGVGPIDATKNAMINIINKDDDEIALIDFSTKVKVPLDVEKIHFENLSNIVGTDALLSCTSVFEYKNRLFTGTSTHSNSSIAECQSIIDAFQKIVQISEWENID